MSTPDDDFVPPDDATELTGAGWASDETAGTGDDFVPPDDATELGSGNAESTTQTQQQRPRTQRSTAGPQTTTGGSSGGTGSDDSSGTSSSGTDDSGVDDFGTTGIDDNADGTVVFGGDPNPAYTESKYKVSGSTLEMEHGDLVQMEGDISTRAWQVNVDPDSGADDESWEPEETSTLDSLLDFVKNYDMSKVERDDDEADWFLTKEGAARLDEKYPPPWAAGYGMRMVAFGGVNSEERRRVIIAPRTLRSMVSGDLNVTVEGKGEMRAEWSSMDSISGTDRLVVNGDVDQTFKSRTTIITHGSVNRTWLGRIHRFVGQEGVICAGIFARMYFGVQMTMSAVASGDVYGGAIKVAAFRFYLSKFGYRASKTANWAMAAYLRTGMVVLEPAVNTVAQDGPVPKAKKAASIIAALCPFIEILGGLAMLPISVVIAIYKKVRKKKPPPPAGPPRCRTISCSNIIEISATNVTT